LYILFYFIFGFNEKIKNNGSTLFYITLKMTYF
jgi:hypothetical protein